ncbi:hypothetical protein ACLX1H_000642 [Fusarium chlamydosporum]
MEASQATTSSSNSTIADEAEKKQRRKLQNRRNQRARRERLNDNVPPNTQTKERKSGFGVKQWRLDEFDLDTKGSMQKHKQQSKARDDQTVVPISNERLFLTNMYNGTLSASDVELYSLQLEIHKRLVSVSQLANPLSDHLLYLVNYNAFRGLFLNKVTLSKLTDHLVVGSDRTYKLDIMMGLKQDALCNQA